MSKLLEFFLGSILIALLSIALIVFSALHYIFRGGIVADCSWHGSAKTWIDSNEDGVLNNGESPLGKVEIHIDDLQNQRADVGWPALTDKNGNARLVVLMLGCSTGRFEVYASPPEGYRMTTKPRVEVSRDYWRNLDAENVYYFGFISDK